MYDLYLDIVPFFTFFFCFIYYLICLFLTFVLNLLELWKYIKIKKQFCLITLNLKVIYFNSIGYVGSVWKIKCVFYDLVFTYNLILYSWLNLIISF